MAQITTKRKLEIQRLFEREGVQRVEIVHTRGQHFRITGHHGDKVVDLITSSTPSCQRADMNLRAQLRRQIRQPL